MKGTSLPAQEFYSGSISTKNVVSQEPENVNLVNINANFNTVMDGQSQSSTSNPRVLNGEPKNMLANCSDDVCNFFL